MTAHAEFILDFVQNLGRPHQIVARVVMPHHVLPQFIDALHRNIDLYRGRWGELPNPGPPQPAPHETQGASAVPPAAAGSPEGQSGGGGGGSPGIIEQKQDAVPPESARQATAQDIYDDLKIRDELLSGAYANAVMIGHGAHEFSFDFITNFYPHSAVSTRVFLAAGQVPRLLDSLKGTWEQLRNRMQPPPDNSGFDPEPPPA